MTFLYPSSVLWFRRFSVVFVVRATHMCGMIVVRTTRICGISPLLVHSSSIMSQSWRFFDMNCGSFSPTRQCGLKVGHELRQRHNLNFRLRASNFDSGLRLARGCDESTVQFCCVDTASVFSRSCYHDVNCHDSESPAAHSALTGS